MSASPWKCEYCAGQAVWRLSIHDRKHGDVDFFVCEAHRKVVDPQNRLAGGRADLVRKAPERCRHTGIHDPTQKTLGAPRDGKNAY